jgi:hypothetical protein
MLNSNFRAAQQWSTVAGLTTEALRSISGLNV